MSGAITTDDMRMHTLVGQDGVCVCVYECLFVCAYSTSSCVCSHVRGYIGQMSEARTSPSWNIRRNVKVCHCAIPQINSSIGHKGIIQFTGLTCYIMCQPPVWTAWTNTVVSRILRNVSICSSHNMARIKQCNVLKGNYYLLLSHYTIITPLMFKDLSILHDDRQ